MATPNTVDARDTTHHFLPEPAVEGRTPALQVRPRRLLVGIDFSELSEYVLDVALETAASTPATEVHCLNVVRAGIAVLDPTVAPEAALMNDELARLRELVVRRVQAFIARRGSLHVRGVTAHVTSGAPASEIAWCAARLDADLVLVGTESLPRFERFFLGSVAEKTVRLTGCPVYVVRQKKHESVAEEPKVEPVCPACAEVRIAENDTSLWCAQHSAHHPRAHVYSYDGISSNAAKPWGFDGP